MSNRESLSSIVFLCREDCKIPAGVSLLAGHTAVADIWVIGAAPFQPEHQFGDVPIHSLPVVEQTSICAPLNEVLQRSVGSFVVVVDGEDSVDPKYLISARELMDADTAGLLCWSRLDGQITAEYRQELSLSAILCDPIPRCFLLRKSALGELGGFSESSFLDPVADAVIRLMGGGTRFKIVPEALHRIWCNPARRTRIASHRQERFDMLWRNNRALCEANMPAFAWYECMRFAEVSEWKLFLTAQHERALALIATNTTGIEH